MGNAGGDQFVTLVIVSSLLTTVIELSPLSSNSFLFCSEYHQGFKEANVIGAGSGGAQTHNIRALLACAKERSYENIVPKFSFAGVVNLLISRPYALIVHPAPEIQG